MKKPIFLIGLIFLATISSIGISFPVMAHEGEQHGSSSVTYKVNEINGTPASWFTADFTQINYTVAENSLLNLTVNDKSNELIDIEVGNLTQTNISDTTAATNLVLNYWQMSGEFGFIANTSWSDIFTDLQELNLDSLSTDIQNKTYLGQTLEIAKIDLTAGMQETTLYYHTNTGLLLETITGFGNFKIGLTISTQSGIIETDSGNGENNTQNTTVPIFLISVSIALLALPRFRTNDN